MMVPVPLINIGPIGPEPATRRRSTARRRFTVNIIRGDRRNGDRPARSRNAADGVDELPQAGRQHRRQVDPAVRDLRQQPHLRHRHPRLRQRARCSSASARTPFVVNLGETFDLVNVSNPLGAENAEADDLADKNVTSFILEVPISCLVCSASQPIIGGWTTASLGVGRPTDRPDAVPRGQPAARPTDGPG